EYHAAGQGPLLHVRAADRQCRWFNASTLPLGILEDLPLRPVEPIALAPGDLFVLLTDGFYEARAPHGELLGRERVAAIVAKDPTPSAADVIEALSDEVGRFTAGAPQEDDQTAVVVKRVG